MHAVENIFMYPHIVLGVLAVFAGSVALYSKKGHLNHIRFGTGIKGVRT